MLLSSSYLLNYIMDYTYSQLEINLLTKANIVARVLTDDSYAQNNTSPFRAFSDIEKEARIIYVDREGKLLYDSQNLASNSQMVSEPGILSALDGENVSFKTGEKEDLYISVAVPVVSKGETVGAVCLKAWAGNTYEYYTQMRNTLIVISVITSLLACLLCLFFVSALTKPLTTLSNQIKKMSEKDLRQSVELSGSVEINDLVSSFNTLMERIEYFDTRRQEFVSNASHELKTPMSSIKLICESLLQNPDADKETVADFLQDMNDEVDRLTRIINKLLNLTKLDASEDETEIFQFSTVNIKTLTENVLSSLSLLARKKRIRLEGILTDNVFIRADADHLWEAIYNIVDNSIKYTPEGGRVYTELFKMGENVHINIMDNGIGMAPEETAKIFDRFYRVDKARSRETGGTGLGLSIALSSVNLHGGYIEVESTEGVGSLFRIVLPLQTDL